MNRGTTSAGSATSRAGYTLLELLVASLLIATLMAATWNLMTMYSGFLDSGRKQAAEQQLVRSLMDLLADDLRAAIPGSTGDSSSPTGIGTIGAKFADITGIESQGVTSPLRDGDSDSANGFHPFDALNAANDVARLPMTLFSGDDQSLTLIAARSQPDFRMQTPDSAEESLAMGGAPWEGEAPAEPPLGVDASSRLGVPRGYPLALPVAREWTQVMYRFEPPRAMQQEEQGLSPGLHRFEIPIEYLNLLTEARELAAGDLFTGGRSLGENTPSDLMQTIDLLQQQGLRGIAHEHIPEVVACRFEFLGERGWRPWWETTFSRDQPIAVRVELMLLSSTEQRELMSLLGSEDADRDETDAAPAPSQTMRGDGDDPFAAFQPRRYERMILLETPHGDRGEGDPVPYEEGDPFGLPSSQLLTGGRP